MSNYHNNSAAQLAKQVVEIEADIALFTEERKALLAELAERFKVSFDEAYAKAAKSHGKVIVKEPTYTLEVDIRQTVKWDQTKLMAAGEKMKPEEAKHIIDVELSVSEKTYNALPPGDVKKALTDARTTKLSAPSIKVVFPTGEKS